MNRVARGEVFKVLVVARQGLFDVILQQRCDNETDFKSINVSLFT